MELVNMKVILSLVALVVLPLARGGCKEDLMKPESDFGECLGNFGVFFGNVGSSGTDMSDPDAIFNVICSKEGQAAFACLFKHMADCPELMTSDDSTNGPADPLAVLKALENIPGFDFDMFMKGGGMEGVCAMMIGPCSEVKNCYTAPQSGMAKREASRVRRGSVSSMNYYLTFQTQSGLMCGTMKEQMTCMINALEQCPDSVVDMVEEQFEQAVKMSMPDYGIVSYQHTKEFVQKECPKMPKDFSEDMCTKDVIVSQNFTECNENVSAKYSNAKTCDVYALSKQCIMDNIQPQCGDETAMFFAQNTHIIFPGIPDDCASRDTSGSDAQQTSFGMLLVANALSLVVLPLARGGCKEDLLKPESDFRECLGNFGVFFGNVGSSGTDMSDPDAIFNVICSKEGQAAFACLFKHMADCPELMTSDDSTNGPADPLAVFKALENIPGFDFDMFMKGGGMEGVCAMMIGPCSEVKNCYTAPQSGMAKREASRVRRGSVSSMNYYLTFQTQSGLMCGTMKEQMTCMINALEQCPDSVVDMVEEQFEQAVKMSMPDYGIVSYQHTKEFVQKECPKMPKDFSEDMCTKDVIVSQNFTECNENVSAKYSDAKTCDVYALSKQCIMDNIQPQCGDETAMFFAQNTHIIFPGIPDDCASRDTSGSDAQQTSFGMLLISTLFSLIYAL